MILGYLFPASLSGYLAAGYLMLQHDATLLTAAAALSTVGAAAMVIGAMAGQRG